jgi:anthranilate 1,2-dioxygenase large subunit
MVATADSFSAREKEWPEGGLTRVPFWVYQNSETYADEQEQIFRGDAWHYLCLEVELRDPGDFCTTFAGDMPVIVSRDADGQIYAFENRCAHRGALICLEDRGKGVKKFSCVYHAWSYNRRGDLVGVGFEHGVQGKGGMPATFIKSEHGPRKLRVEALHGIVFGTLSESIQPLHEELGAKICGRIARVLKDRTPVILGRFTQALPNNWKLYVENVKDSYHASILHLFFTTFQLNRLSQKGAIIVDKTGGHHVSYSMVDRNSSSQNSDYSAQELRSDSRYKLKDQSILRGFPEFEDNITLQILSIFPTFVLQQIQNVNSLAILTP